MAEEISFQEAWHYVLYSILKHAIPMQLSCQLLRSKIFPGVYTIIKYGGTYGST